MLDGYVKKVLLTNRDSMPQLKKVHLDAIPVPESLFSGRGFEVWAKAIERLVTGRMAGAKNGKVAEVEIESMILERVGGGERT